MSEFGINNMILAFLDSSHKMGYPICATASTGITVSIASAGIWNITTRTTDTIEIEYINERLDMSKATISRMLVSVFNQIGLDVMAIHSSTVMEHTNSQYRYYINNRKNRQVICNVHVTASRNPLSGLVYVGQYQIPCRDINSLIAETVTRKISYPSQLVSAIYDMFVLSHLNGCHTYLINEKMRYYGSPNNRLEKVLKNSTEFMCNADKAKGVNLVQCNQQVLEGIYNRAMKFMYPIVAQSKQPLTWIGYEWAEDGTGVAR